jgi:uncharacterized membrane protein
VLTTKLNADKVVPEIAGLGGTVLRSSLPVAEETRLREAPKNHGVPQPEAAAAP